MGDGGVGEEEVRQRQRRYKRKKKENSFVQSISSVETKSTDNELRLERLSRKMLSVQY